MFRYGKFFAFSIGRSKSVLGIVRNPQIKLDKKICTFMTVNPKNKPVTPLTNRVTICKPAFFNHIWYWETGARVR